MLAEAQPYLLTHRADGRLLIVAVCDFVVDGYAQQIQPLRPAVHQLLQIIPAENAADLSLGAGLVIPEVRLEPVGGEHHGAASKFPLQTVGVQHRLLAADVRVLAGALGLDNGQRQAVLAEEHIVGIAHLAHHSGHALNGVFLLHVRVRAVEPPAHLLHVHINVDFAGRKFGEVLRCKDTLLLVLLLGGGQLAGHLLDLSAQSFYLRILFAQQALLLLDFLHIHLYPLGGDPFFIKLSLHIVAAIAVVHPLDELEQSPQSGQRITGAHTALGVHRQIAQFDDERQLAPGVVIHRETKARLVDERLQVVLVGHLHRVVRGVDPLHRQLQRLPASDGTHGRSGGIHLLRLDRGGGKQCVFLVFIQKIEVGHETTSFV